MDRRRFLGLLPWALIVLASYVIAASAVYRFRFPEKTETELFMELPQALLWRY